MTSVGGGAALHYIMPLREHRAAPPDEEVAPPPDDREVTSVNGVEEAKTVQQGVATEQQLNFTYTLKPPRPAPGGYAVRLEVRCLPCVIKRARNDGESE